MLKNLTQFYYPKTVAEAREYLKNTELKTAVIAGGTSQALRNNNNIEALVDITKIEDLCCLRKDSKYIGLGATTPMQEVYKSNFSGVSGSLLKLCAGKIGSTLLRKSITVGGAVGAIFPWSDFPVALLALDAKVICENGETQRAVSILEVVKSKAGHFPKKEEIITEIRVPNYTNSTGASFIKMSKTSNDYALISVATRLTMDKGTIKEARIALNALTLRPERFLDAEKLLVGKKPTKGVLKKAAAQVINKAKLRKDFRASDEYRKEVGKVLILRSLEESLKMAKKQGEGK